VKIFVRSLALMSVLSLRAWAQAPQLAGTWSNESGSFDFGTDATVTMTVGQQTQSGTWLAQGNQLQVSLTGGTLMFLFQVQGETLVLQDQNGQYILTRTPAAAPAPENPTGPPLSDRQFLGFVEHYRSMMPDTVYDHLKRTTEDQRLMISLHGALEQDLLFQACQGSKAAVLTWQTTAGVTGCSRVAADRQQHLQLFSSMGMAGDPFAQRDIEQLQMINHYKCVLGEHSRELCAAYYQTQSEISRGQQDTSMTIIDNIGAAGCQEHWEEDQGGARTYLGCW